MSKILTKEQAMKKFGIEDLRKFNSKDFIKLVSSIDRMDPEVAKELIAQIPNFLNFAKEGLVSVKDSFEKISKSDDESIKSIYESYDLIIESLNNELRDGELSLDEKLEISRMIRDFIHDKEEAHFRQQEQRHELFKSFAKGVGVACLGIVAILGGSEIAKGISENPEHDDDYS